MVIAQNQAAFQAGYYVGKAMFFFAVVAFLWWLLYRSRHRR
jgi:hypothetical protein